MFWGVCKLNCGLCGPDKKLSRATFGSRAVCCARLVYSLKARPVVFLCCRLSSPDKSTGILLSSNKPYGLLKQTTVKLGYNDHGYNELTVIASNFNLLVWFSMFFQQNFMLITNKNSFFHGYNEFIFKFLELFCRKCYKNYKITSR